MFSKAIKKQIIRYTLVVSSFFIHIYENHLIALAMFRSSHADPRQQGLERFKILIACHLPCLALYSISLIWIN